MIEFKIGGPNKASSLDKPKRKGNARTSSTSDVSFADLVSDSSEASAVTEAAGTAPNSPTGSATDAPLYIPYEDIPKDPKEHGNYLLQQLEALEQDILSGEPTQAVERLKLALANSPLDSAHLTDKQRRILEELHLRASVEVAKMEEK